MELFSTSYTEKNEYVYKILARVHGKGLGVRYPKGVTYSKCIQPNSNKGV